MLSLKINLRLIIHMLPFAATAGTKEFATRLDSQRRLLEHFNDFRFEELLFYLGDTHTHFIAGHTALNEDDQAVNPRNAFAFEGERLEHNNNFVEFFHGSFCAIS